MKLNKLFENSLDAQAIDLINKGCFVPRYSHAFSGIRITIVSDVPNTITILQLIKLFTIAGLKDDLGYWAGDCIRVNSKAIDEKEDIIKQLSYPETFYSGPVTPRVTILTCTQWIDTIIDLYNSKNDFDD